MRLAVRSNAVRIFLAAACSMVIALAVVVVNPFAMDVLGQTVTPVVTVLPANGQITQQPGETITLVNGATITNLSSQTVELTDEGAATIDGVAGRLVRFVAPLIDVLRRIDAVDSDTSITIPADCEEISSSEQVCFVPDDARILIEDE